MSSVKQLMKETHVALLEERVDKTTSDFAKRFHFDVGDYLKYRKETSGLTTHARVVSVDGICYNQRGGFTALIKVAPLLASGGLGCTKCLTIWINANGGGLGGFRIKDVEVIESRKETRDE